ncbi:MAG: hypothetical protein UW18_C0017G0009 [Microgenomates group bacterium GW2011_GWF1_44_10]|nr:MAG: hypothetical protein UW18_C0017G0009 [Microgenomates group bacterium GW2011_GWF1_44_10]
MIIILLILGLLLVFFGIYFFLKGLTDEITDQYIGNHEEIINKIKSI